MSIPDKYSQLLRSRYLFLGGSGFFLILLTLGSLTLGASSVTISQALEAFFFPSRVDNGFVLAVIWKIRLPRVCAALLAGASLGLAGGVMQGLLRNPLASPFTLGISSAAGFGASLAIVTGQGIVGSVLSGQMLIVSNAFVFALMAFLLVFLLAKLRGMGSQTLILSGIAVMYLFSSMTSFLQFIATPEQLSAVVFWMMGALSGITWIPVSVMFGAYLLAAPVLIRSSWDLNALSSGEETAVSLGINVKRITVICMVFSALLTASIISFTGVIGFIGLVAPHITRMICGGDNRFLLPASSLGGAILLLAADTASRIIIPPSEIPLGIMTSFIGVPFFIYILIKRKQAGSYEF